jgi:hypothetical protein
VSILVLILPSLKTDQLTKWNNLGIIILCIILHYLLIGVYFGSNFAILKNRSTNKFVSIGFKKLLITLHIIYYTLYYLASILFLILPSLKTDQLTKWNNLGIIILCIILHYLLIGVYFVSNFAILKNILTNKFGKYIISFAYLYANKKPVPKRWKWLTI